LEDSLILLMSLAPEICFKSIIVRYFVAAGDCNRQIIESKHNHFSNQWPHVLRHSNSIEGQFKLGTCICRPQWGQIF